MVIKDYVKNKQIKKADIYMPYIKKHLGYGSKVLDFGTATGCMTHKLKNYYYMHPLDVIDQVLFKDVKVQKYSCDKKLCRIPYPDKYFDGAIVLGVLHHTPDPIHIIRELKRTCKKIIICEDIYTDVVGKYKTYVWDSIVNFEFKGHPHTNKTDMEWKRVFNSLGLRLNIAYYRDYNNFKHALYVLS